MSSNIKKGGMIKTPRLSMLKRGSVVLFSLQKEVCEVGVMPLLTFFILLWPTENSKLRDWCPG